MVQNGCFNRNLFSSKLPKKTFSMFFPINVQWFSDPDVQHPTRVLCWSFLNRPQEPLKTKPLLRKAGLRSDPRCTLGELCARPSSEGAAKLGEWQALPDLLILVCIEIIQRWSLLGNYWEVTIFNRQFDVSIYKLAVFHSYPKLPESPESTWFIGIDLCGNNEQSPVSLEIGGK